MKTANPSTFQLQPAHRALLQSAFADEDVAIAAWQQWLDQTDFEDLDWESYQLLPTLYQRLLQCQVEHPLMNRMKGIQRLFWCKNQVRLAEIQPLLTELAASGISIIWLDNPPWGDQATNNSGLQLLNAYHFQTSPEDCPPLIAVLQRLGWQCPAIDPIKSLEYTGKIWLEHSQHLSIALHSQLSSGYALPELMTVFRQRAVPITIGSHINSIWRLHDQVTHHMMQFGQAQDMMSLPTIANLITLLRQPDLDWEALLSTAKHYRLLVPLQTLLSTLHELKIDVPEAARSIEVGEIYDIERQEYAVLSQNQSGIWSRAVRKYAQYHRLTLMSGEQPSLFAFLNFLCESWSIQSIWDIPVCVLSRQFRYWQQQRQHFT